MEDYRTTGPHGGLQDYRTPWGTTGLQDPMGDYRTTGPHGGPPAPSYLLTLAEEEVMEVRVVLHGLQQRTR
ncbi:hypothetical protein EYF80_056475 [Liparis tanakae]|uniref:Uncharacterized protein n=1 Tax=Liparis tanakae TaxID=230148 RepID=A0A4Z2EWS5_9TELE|nr:hypothetical protein EYF80_056475 [Liparis tanakae]